MGMIYRDLKPQNVILNADGHIQLVDLGGVADVGGKVLGTGVLDEQTGGLFKTDTQRQGIESNPSVFRADSTGNAGQVYSYGGAMDRSGIIRGMPSGNNSNNSNYTANAAKSKHNISLNNSQQRSIYVASEPAPAIRRAKSIMGTCGFMGMISSIILYMCCGFELYFYILFY